ncbi:MAG: cytochrome c1 [Betaproteobacteria bacterium]|nr:cytochrome c1 [Betaproteobacteria bacterium]MBL8532206.1 cytochrome c1 [Betaproteobacteria bacterium]
MKALRTLLVGFLSLVPVLPAAAADHAVLDKAPIDNKDVSSLQRGAKLFVNYCLNCHSAAYMRYNRLGDLGLSEEQIKDNLMFASEKVGDQMVVGMNGKEAAKWFGAQPPDLSVIARSRGADWLYTYLRTFYRDETRPTGWNNVTFPNVGMPHVLWELQGQQELQHEGGDQKTEHGAHAAPKLVLAQPGSLGSKEYDAAVADLVNYLVFQGEPARAKRVQIGIMTLLFLGILFIPAYALKKDYWKDVH